MSKRLYRRKWKAQGSTLDIEPRREKFESSTNWLFLIISSMMAVW